MSDKSLAHKIANKYYQSFSGTDTITYLIFPSSSKLTLLGALSTVSYSTFRPKKPVNMLSTILTPAHTYGPRVVAGTMIFTLINKNFAEELLDNNPWLREFGRLKADELPLFDLMIISANEYGAYSQAHISGVSIVDESQVLSIEDMFTEGQFSFVAKDVIPFGDFGRNSISPKEDTPFTWEHSVYLEGDNETNTPTPTEDKGPVKIFLDGTELGFTYGPPYIKPEVNRTYVPMRDTFDILGYPTFWDEELKEAVVRFDKKELRLNPTTSRLYGSYVGSDTIMKPPAELKDDAFTGTGYRTYIPLSDFFTKIGYNVVWDEPNWAVRITSRVGKEQISSNLSTKEIQEHLNRHGYSGTPIKIDGSIGPKTKYALNVFCDEWGIQRVKNFKSIPLEIREKLIMPNTGMKYTPKKEITATLKSNVKIYSKPKEKQNLLIKTYSAKSSFITKGVVSGWYHISEPIIGWIPRRYFVEE